MFPASRRPFTGPLSEREIEAMKFGLPVTLGDCLVQAWASLETAAGEGEGPRWDNAVLFARRRIETAETLVPLVEDPAKRALAVQEIAVAREEFRAA
jgi:hypothetical protein